MLSRGSMQMVFAPGDRVELIFTDDPYTHLRPGDRGTVIGVRDHPQRNIEVDWDSGSTLSILPDAGDRIRNLPPDGADAAAPSGPTAVLRLVGSYVLEL